MFRKKTKCDVCGFRFVPEKESTYIAERPRDLIETFTEPPQKFSMIDCPSCGCQILLASYYPHIDIEIDEDLNE